MHLKHNHDANVYLHNNTLENGVIIASESEEDEHYFHFLATYNRDFLLEFIKSSKLTHMGFSGVHTPIYDLICNDISIDWQNPCKTYVLKGDFKPVENFLYTCDSLSLDDAEEVDKYYTYRSDDSIKQVKKDIISAESSCIRLNGELASWCCVHSLDGSMGPLYTKEEFRGLGLAAIVSSRLIEKLIAKNVLPFMHIVSDNSISLSLADKLSGMGFNHDCVWFGIKK